MDLDPNLFNHILSNLLENAVKYSPGKEEPELHLIYEDKFLTIKIVDYGIGIPEEDKKRLFETFFRASNVDNIQGTGLGLTIVKQYVESHSGSIDVQSEEGFGTTFSLRFPYHQENANR